MTIFKNGSVDFNSLEPLAIYNYLEENGWKEERRIDTRGSVLKTSKNDKKYSVLLPLEKDLPDFESRMYDVFKVLEVVENRARSQIIAGLINLAEIAREKECEIICLKFKFIEEDKKQLPAKKMGAVLTSLQNCFHAVGGSEAGFHSGNARTPKEVLEKT